VDNCKLLWGMVMRHVAAMAEAFEVAPIVPTVGCISPLHDVVHLLGGETAPVARRVPHQPQAAHPLPA